MTLMRDMILLPLKYNIQFKTVGVLGCINRWPTPFLDFSGPDSDSWPLGGLPSLSHGTFCLLKAMTKHLMESSLSRNSKVAYDKAIMISAFNDFRLQFNFCHGLGHKN